MSLRTYGCVVMDSRYHSGPQPDTKPARAMGDVIGGDPRLMESIRPVAQSARLTFDVKLCGQGSRGNAVAARELPRLTTLGGSEMQLT